MTGDGAATMARSGTMAALRRYGYPLMALVRRDVKKRYATSVLGMAWTILQPLVLLSIYVAVFGFILRSGRAAEDARAYVIYLLAGMLPYLAINEGLHRAASSLREDKALLEREVFPAEVIPAARVLTASVGEAVGLLLLVLLTIVLGRPLSPWLLTLPLLVALRLLLTCGIAWAVSMLSVFIADLTEMLSLMLNAWLFLTPIFYAAADLPPVVRGVLVFNPLAPLVEAYRAVLVSGQNPAVPAATVAVWAVAVAVSGLWFFRRALDRGKDFL